MTLRGLAAAVRAREDCEYKKGRAGLRRAMWTTSLFC
jgi:hypothetical protein